MHWSLSDVPAGLTLADVPAWLGTTWAVIKVIIGFSLIIFVHELGHFLAAKWAGIRVDRFAIGFGARLFGWRTGEGFTLGSRPSYSAEELRQRGWGETDYCFKLLPVGGYVKMLGQEDIQINDDTGEIKLSDDPRAFSNKPVGRRMIVVSAGVVFNLLFAILAFMCVYMMGRQDVAPQVSVLEAGSPAARAGLRSGDIVLEANGQHVETFRDIVVAEILAEGSSVRLRVKRDGEPLPDELVMQLKDTTDTSPLASGLRMEGTTELRDAPESLEDVPGLKAGDKITDVAGQKVGSASDVPIAFNRYVWETGQAQVALTVQRADPAAPDHVSTHIVYALAVLQLAPIQVPGTAEGRRDTDHILGLFPRRQVMSVDAGEPAERAGIKRGDVVVQWGGVPNPLYAEIMDSVETHAGEAIPVVVQRGDQTVTLTLTPRVPFHLFSAAKPRAGLGFGYEARVPVVADVAEGTPAASLNLPRGALLTMIDGQPVANWFDAIRHLTAAAGRTVTVQYRSGAIEAEGRLAVPSSIVNELKLSPLALIMSINGETEVEIGRDKPARLPSWMAVRALLEKHAGESVRVQYQPSLDELTPAEAAFYVRPDRSNVDPWQLRILFSDPGLPYQPVQITIQTSNPLTAAYLGVKSTGDVLAEVYRVLRTIAKTITSGRTSTVQHVSGPVGIIGMAVERAKVGFGELLFFFGFLSVNLAVLNFIPFPVVDGGLMVFLLIEKIKGKPLGLKTQMVATLVGLATIVLVFLLITIQDITRFFR